MLIFVWSTRLFNKDFFMTYLIPFCFVVIALNSFRNEHVTTTSEQSFSFSILPFYGICYCYYHYCVIVPLQRWRAFACMCVCAYHVISNLVKIMQRQKLTNDDNAAKERKKNWKDERASTNQRATSTNQRATDRNCDTSMWAKRNRVQCQMVVSSSYSIFFSPFFFVSLFLVKK